MNNEIKNLPDLRELGDVIGDGFLWGSDLFSYRTFPAKNSQVTHWRKNFSTAIANNFKKLSANNKIYSKIEDSLSNPDNYNISPKDLNLKSYQNYLLLAKKLNLNSITINVDWARVEPKQGTFSISALKMYKKIISDAVALGVVPIVTLWDLSHPIWFENSGGFTNKKNIKFFLNFVGRVLNFIPSGTTIITFNNPSQIVEAKSIFQNQQPINILKTYRNIASAHHQAAHLIKHSSKLNKVGMGIPISIFGSINKQKNLNNRLVRNILLGEIKKSSDFLALSINGWDDLKFNKKQKGSINLTDNEFEKEIYGDFGEGTSENQLVRAISYFDKKLQMPILIMNNSVSDLEQKYYSKELEITINAIFKTALQGSNIIGLVYSSLAGSKPIKEGIFTSRSLSLEDSKRAKVRFHPRARILHGLIAKVNKVRKPNYQPAVSAIIESMNKYKQSKKNKVKRFLGESAKKINNKVDEVKYKNKLPLSNKMLAASQKTTLKLSAGGEGVNPFDIAKKASLDSINRVKLKSNQVKRRVADRISKAKPGSGSASASVKNKTTRLVGDFVKSRTSKKPKAITKKPASAKLKTGRNKKVV